MNTTTFIDFKISRLSQKNGSTTSYHAQKVCQDIKQLIEDNLCGPMPTLADMALRFSIPLEVLKSEFQKEFGFSIYQYHMKLKFEMALVLLQTHNVATVSDMLGYSQPIKFLIPFKKRFGITPKQYQLKHFGRTKDQKNNCINLK
jgi:AraC-like DNA-binding protein